VGCLIFLKKTEKEERKEKFFRGGKMKKVEGGREKKIRKKT